MGILLSVVEIVSFLYAILMNVGNAQSSSSPTLPEATINLVTEALCMLNFMGTVDLKVLQVSDVDEFDQFKLAMVHVRQMVELKFIYVVFAEKG